MRVLEQRLRRNAAPDEARPAKRFLFLHDGHGQTELSGPDGGDVAARSGADHDDVVLLHGLSLQRRQRDKITGRTGRFLRNITSRGSRLGDRWLETSDARAQLPVLVPQFPVRLGQPLEPPGDSPRTQERANGK